MRYKVFLDSNIYIASNYSFQNASFSALRGKASSSDIELQINSVIEGEVKTHIARDIKHAVRELRRAMANDKFAGFRNLQNFGEKLTIPQPKEWAEAGLNEFQEFLNACNVRRISLNGIDVEKLLQDYFDQKPPFEQSKPEEFKDAIAAASIINQIRDLQTGECYCIVSGDKGFIKAFEQYSQSTNIKLFSSLQDLIKFFALSDKEEAEYAKLVQSYLDSGSLTESICDAVKEVVDSATLDVVDLEYCAEAMEVVDVDDIKYKADLLSIDGDNCAEVAVEAICTLRVYYEYTDENQSYYDKEDRVYLWQRIVELEDTYRVPLSFVVVADTSNFIQTIDADDEFLDIIALTDAPERIDLEEDMLVNRETLSDSGLFHEEYDPDAEQVVRYDALTTCPDCGAPLGESNDGGNGFCVNCAPNH